MTNYGFDAHTLEDIFNYLILNRGYYTVARRLWILFSSGKNYISRVSALRANVIYFLLYKRAVFDNFPKIYYHFPKIFQNCSECQTNVSAHFRNIFEDFPKIAKDNRRRSEDDWIIHQQIQVYLKGQMRNVIEYDIFTCEDIVSFLSICYHSVYHWLLHNKRLYYHIPL